MWLLGGFRTSGAFTHAAGRPFTINSGGSLGNAIDPFRAVTAVPNLIGAAVTPHNVDCWYYNSRASACRSPAPSASDFLQ